jgi:predicted nucleotide-binding protein
MTKEEVLQKLKGKYKVVEEREIYKGIQLRLDNKAVVNCYVTGRHNVMGKNTRVIEELLNI